MDAKVDAVVLASGGLDSTVALAVAVREHGRRVAAIHAGYGHRTQARELEAFGAVADHYGIERRLVVSLDYLRSIGGSALTDRAIEVPEGELHREGVPVTYVPFRNGHLLAVAVSWAEVLGAGSVYIGAVEEDSSGYPDCREEFFRAFERAAALGTAAGAARIVTPLIHLRKSEIVKLGAELGAPLELTWSCYRSSGPACGRCDSCLLRLRGFREAGMEDPVLYAAGATEGCD
ncbi:MAG TPA: 7-cyano-7-deazaguanine synthase QueC [Deltaproteobacteria bacterium]|nr:7-cyano-7-deazaguanine synthase QueC [Deltaproteobacteria bacterium]